MTLGPKWAASAAPLSLPTPGSGSILSPTVPNPVQFNFAPGTVVSSAQQNSNNYGFAQYLFALVGGLNGCNWLPSASIGSVLAVAPLNASIASCAVNSGTGVQLTLSLATSALGPISATTIIGSSNGGTSSTYVPPVYAVNGTAVASTLHSVIGNCATTTSACNLSFSGAAQFSATNAFACAGSIGAGSQPIQYIANAAAYQANVQFTAAGASNQAFVECTGS